MKRFIQSAIGRLGYNFVNIRKLGWEPWQDVGILLQGVERPVFFDVGAHTGETLAAMALHFPRANFHCFEPDPESFSLLQEMARRFPNARAYPLAMGDHPQMAKLFLNRASMTNSILEVAAESKEGSSAGFFERVGEAAVTVATLDQFCREQGISHIDFLKTDCQGFDLRVLKGASDLLSKRRVHVIQCEGMFDSEYVGQGWFHEILHYLTDMDYAPVALHNPARNERHEIQWADVIFKRRHDP